MPFTPAHPAIALPFLRRAGVDPVALVVGCMVPDFEYFLRARMESQLSHTAPGLLLFDLPLGLLLVVTFRRVIAASMLRALPRSIVSRFVGAFSNARPTSIVVTAACVTIGAGSHIGWDAFTHHDGAIVEAFPWLSTTIAFPAGRSAPLFKLLQHGSTLLGAVAIVATVWRWPQAHIEHQPSARVRTAYLVALALAVPATIGFRALAEDGGRTHYAHLIVAGCSGFLLALVIGSLVARRISDR